MSIFSLLNSQLSTVETCKGAFSSNVGNTFVKLCPGGKPPDPFPTFLVSWKGIGYNVANL